MKSRFNFAIGYFKSYFESMPLHFQRVSLSQISSQSVKPIIPEIWIIRIGVASVIAIGLMGLLGAWLVYLARRSAADDELDELESISIGSSHGQANEDVQHPIRGIQGIQTTTNSILWRVATKKLPSENNSRGKFEIIGAEDEDEIVKYNVDEDPEIPIHSSSEETKNDLEPQSSKIER